MSLNTHLRKLPDELIFNKILPYTYHTKPKEHLVDIRSFRVDYKMVIAYYETMLNEYILLHDLLEHYINNIDHYRFSAKNCEFVDKIWRNYSEHGHTVHPQTIHRNIRLLWGMYPLRERTTFINEYVLVDYF